MKHSLILNFLRSIILLCGLLTVASRSVAQQDPLYGLWLNNPLVINPAYTGINNNLTAFTTYRNQWAGFDGNPTTLNAGGHMSLLQNKIGAGLMLVNDKIGENTNTQVTGSFAYKLPINAGTTLSFGMQGGVHQLQDGPIATYFARPHRSAVCSGQPDQTQYRGGSNAEGR